ncbi:MAG: hypothetical protein QOG10_2678 [Kribbellaceae bacterium]|nr:hypothetical protein [Kribbellaceae bacterium]
MPALRHRRVRTDRPRSGRPSALATYVAVALTAKSDVDLETVSVLQIGGVDLSAVGAGVGRETSGSSRAGGIRRPPG